MYRDLLVHVDPSDAGRRRLAYALSMAEEFGARLTGIHVRTPPDLPPLYKPSYIDRITKELDAQLALSAELSAELFQSATEGATIPVRWRATHGNMAHGVAEAARYADLVIVGQYEHEGSSHHHPFTLADDVVRLAGRPIVVTPDGAAPFRGDQVAVAWDGSAQSVRALHDAFPLLERAKAIAVITVDGDDGARARLDPDELADHLARHGINPAEIRSVLADGKDTSTILDQLRAGGFDLLVMGAFGHPAWLELIFGGTTLDLLEESPVPVLISR
jgi:nucleotide-binding universal stress UspA family protein